MEKKKVATFSNENGRTHSTLMEIDFLKKSELGSNGIPHITIHYFCRIHKFPNKGIFKYIFDKIHFNL
jgi:hypothetical protein